jgi:enamine deaminase RidA (YjgF/YER057c/UK114 family)
MSSIQRIDAGSRMSEAVIYDGKIYLSGMVAERTIEQSAKEQTLEILEQIDQLLAKAHSNKTMILKANIWLSDISYFDEMNEIWDQWVVKGQAPVRATVEAKLASPKYKVEIMVEAACIMKSATN